MKLNYFISVFAICFLLSAPHNAMSNEVSGEGADLFAEMEAMPELTDQEKEALKGEGWKTTVNLMLEAGATWYDVYKMGRWVAAGAYGTRPKFSGRINQKLESWGVYP